MTTPRPAASSLPLKVLYIAGYGRNGGTLIDRILGSLPGSISLGEVKFLFLKGLIRNELCNCGVPFHDCPFWSEVLASAFGSSRPINAQEIVDFYEPIDRSRYVPLLMARRLPRMYRVRAQRYTEILARLHVAIAEVSGARVLVNSSKFAGYGLVLTRAPEIQLYTLHLVRDSRAHAFSWAKRMRKTEDPSGQSFMRRYSPFSTATQWLYRNAFAELLGYKSYKYRLLRYEDFGRDPMATVRSVAEWVGEDFSQAPFVGTHTVDLQAGHTQSGNPSRFRTGHIDIRVDDQWRADLPFAARAQVTAVTWPLLLRYGYLRRGPLAPRTSS